MEVHTLKGNMLSFYVALALGLPSRGSLITPWDAWDADLIWQGRKFGPFDVAGADADPNALLAIMPSVSRLKLSSRPAGTDRWHIRAPDGETYWAPTLIHAYALAIVDQVFHDEVPDWYEDRRFGKRVFLPPLNVSYGQPGPDENVPNAITFEAPPAGSITYREAMNLAHSMFTSGQAFNYLCDGHSWAQVQLMDGSYHYFDADQSSLGLDPMPSI